MGQKADGPWLVGASSTFDANYLLNASRFCACVCTPLKKKNENLGASGIRGYVGYLR